MRSALRSKKRDVFLRRLPGTVPAPASWPRTPGGSGRAPGRATSPRGDELAVETGQTGLEVGVEPLQVGREPPHFGRIDDRLRHETYSRTGLGHLRSRRHDSPIIPHPRRVSWGDSPAKPQASPGAAACGLRGSLATARSTPGHGDDEHGTDDEAQFAPPRAGRRPARPATARRCRGRVPATATTLGRQPKKNIPDRIIRKPRTGTLIELNGESTPAGIGRKSGTASGLPAARSSDFCAAAKSSSITCLKMFVSEANRPFWFIPRGRRRTRPHPARSAAGGRTSR